MKTANHYLTATEVADKLRFTRHWVYELARAGKLPARRVCPRGRLLFDAQQIERLLESSSTTHSRVPA